jgi:hypothetical protein
MKRQLAAINSKIDSILQILLIQDLPEGETPKIDLTPEMVATPPKDPMKKKRVVKRSPKPVAKKKTK